MRRRTVLGLALALVAALAPGARAAEPVRSNMPGLTPQQVADAFLTRSGSQLQLAGRPFRFSGENVEWLGLVGYGPLTFAPGQTQRYPTDFEIDDALATAHEMGATVVRAQTLGDTFDCAHCLEPSPGVWNPQAFERLDFAVKEARRWGIKLILEFEGDTRSIPAASTGDKIWASWGGDDFYSGPRTIALFEDHIRHVVEHVSTYTGIALKDDPTVAGWMDCNFCTNAAPTVDSGISPWVRTIADFTKSLDPRHLVFDNSAITIDPSPALLAIPSVDVYAWEDYPKGFPGLDGDPATGLDPTIHLAAQTTAAAGKAWMLSEYGWDHTNWVLPSSLQTLLGGIEADPHIVGDLSWALESHTDGHGWQPLPADEKCSLGSMDLGPPTVPTVGGLGCQLDEDGSWWALYYTGIPTLSNTADDMAARAQQLRTHAFAMGGWPSPPAHDVAPAARITSAAGGHVYFEGSAGAPSYSVQRRVPGGAWATVCTRCVTDLSDGWQDPQPPACYRVVAVNLDGVASPPSADSCPASAHAVTATRRPGSRRAPAVSAPASLAATGGSPLLVGLAVLLLLGAAQLATTAGGLARRSKRP